MRLFYDLAFGIYSLFALPAFISAIVEKGKRAGRVG